MRVKSGLLASAWLMTATIPTSAFAADAIAPSETEEERDAIIVTGLRQQDGQNAVAGNGALGDKPLLDTPFSITVVDAEDIAKRQAATIGQIFINDPSVFSFATAGTTNWWGTQIRGLGVRNYYVDDVQLMLYWGGDLPLESIETVEALKGLTGFMYGFGAPGGTISYRTKRPTATPLLSTEIGYRNDSNVYGRIDAGGPLAQDGRLGYRLNVAGEKGETYNTARNNRWLASLALEYEVTPDLKWYATGMYEESKLKGEPFHVYWWAYEDTDLPKVTYDYSKLNIDNSFYEAHTLTTATGLDWTFAPKWSAKLTYGYTSKLHHSNKTFIDLLNRAGDYSGHVYNFAELDRNHFAQAMIQGEIDTGPIRHEIVAGASFMANDSYFGLNDYYYGDDFAGNIYRDQPFRITRDIAFGTDGSPFKERQRALFASDTLHWGEHVQAILGARYTRYKSLDLDGDPTVDSSYRASPVTPTIALILKPVPWASIYGSYVESLEPGGRVPGEYQNAGDILKATVSKQHEIGIKYEHGRLSLTTAAFRIERALQIDRITNGLRFLTQDGKAIYKGVEAIVSYRVTEDLRIGGGAIHLDPSIREVSPENADLIGNVPAEAARWQLVANADLYVAAIPGLSLHGNVRRFGKAPTDDFNGLYIPAYTLANAGFQYDTRIGDRRVTLTGNINNLFGEKYWGLQNFGEDRNASVSIKVYW
jgi:iron complex outermembrane receptor protein